MLLWRFRTYVSPSGREEVQKEIDRYDDYSREAFAAAVRHLAVTPKIEWNEPHSKKLKGEDSLYEIRYMANRCQTRALGYFDSDGKSFVITNICTHKQRIYKPPDAIKTADKNRERIVSRLATTVHLQVDGENFPTDED